MSRMHTRNPLLDRVAKLSVAAAGIAQAAGEEMRSATRAGTDRLASELDLVRRDEFDVMKDEIAALRAEIERLKAERSA